MTVLLFAACAAPAPDAGDTALGAYVKGVLTDVVGNGIDDASVCVHEQPELGCTVTDRGAFLVEGLASEADVSVVFTHPDFQPVAFPHHTADPPVDWDRFLITPGFLELMLPSDAELEPGKGHFGFFAYEDEDWNNTTKLAGVTFSVDSDEGELAYLDSLRMADERLTATSSAGGGAVGNLTPGEYEVSFTGPGSEPCFRRNSWAFTPGEPMPFPVLADTVTFVFIACPPE